MSILTTAILASLLSYSDLPRRGVLGVPFTPASADQAKAAGLAAGEGLIAGTPVAGLTAERAGVQAGDIIVQINDHAAKAQGLSGWVKTLPTGKVVTFKVVRKGEAKSLSAPLAEFPRDPGNDNYTVEYRYVVSSGARMRTIITRPKGAGKHPGLLFIQGFS
ncbi:MAG: PDZ domain-containing protein, partial [Armatimonadota bacterium]